VTRVVCVGDVMVDVLARLPTELAIGSDTPAPINLFGGGSAANTAAWLASTGVATTFVGRVGDDALGRMAVDELARAGVELLVSVDQERPTGTCIVLVDATGERTMVPAAGANSGLGDEPLPDGLVSADSRLHVSAYALFNEGARPAVDLLVTQARAAGAPVSVDAASSAPLAAFGPDAFLAWLAGLGDDAIVFANRDEAEVLAGRQASAEELALSLGSHRCAAIVKCGSDGAVWSDGDRVVHASTQQLTAVDSTGAGDAFAAGVLAALSIGASIDTALDAGNQLAARAIGHAGARP